MTRNTNEKIMDLFNFYYKLPVSVTAVGNLIAAEAKYQRSRLLSTQQLKHS